ncbi:hypothetical protein KUCAC02_001049 [Chaenocephalus aceratus]|uniref:Uncharacterized protein n=1 Tax=Chaenocephalus aceratus TaxID=36190 RepID=A0ACB9XXN5_CHAAC|nr:hypothetical protein KUCAC02_001049 [Chaenocephalus aceratus]
MMRLTCELLLSVSRGKVNCQASLSLVSHGPQPINMSETPPTAAPSSSPGGGKTRSDENDDDDDKMEYCRVFIEVKKQDPWVNLSEEKRLMYVGLGLQMSITTG